jgi:hypothetical protein
VPVCVCPPIPEAYEVTLLAVMFCSKMFIRRHLTTVSCLCICVFKPFACFAVCVVSMNFLLRFKFVSIKYMAGHIFNRTRAVRYADKRET